MKSVMVICPLCGIVGLQLKCAGEIAICPEEDFPATIDALVWVDDVRPFDKILAWPTRAISHTGFTDLGCFICTLD